MPVTTLLPQSVVSNNWPLLNAPNIIVALTSDDPTVVGASGITSVGSPFRVANMDFTDLPVIATGASIDSVSLETIARGATLASQYFVSATLVGTLAGPVITPGTPGGLPGYTRTFTTMPNAPGFVRWKYSQVNAATYQVSSGPVHGGGVAVGYYANNVTWRGSATMFVTIGVSWLGPLIAAGLGGLNLFHESMESLGKLDTLFRDILRSKGILTCPTLSIPEEKELVLKSLFVRPVYG